MEKPDIDIRNLFKQITHSYPERDMELIFFSAPLKKGDPFPPNSAHDCIKWVSSDKLKQHKFHQADVPVVERFAKNKHMRLIVLVFHLVLVF